MRYEAAFKIKILKPSELYIKHWNNCTAISLRFVISADSEHVKYYKVDYLKMQYIPKPGQLYLYHYNFAYNSSKQFPPTLWFVINVDDKLVSLYEIVGPDEQWHSPQICYIDSKWFVEMMKNLTLHSLKLLSK